MSKPILLRGGRVIDPSRGSDGIADVFLQGGRIEAVTDELNAPFSLSDCSTRSIPRSRNSTSALTMFTS